MIGEQRPLIPADAPVKARALQCWKCAVDLREIETYGGQVIGRQCPRCFRFTPNGKHQPVKPAKIK